MNDSDIKLMAKRLQALRKQAGLSGHDAAEATGQSVETVRAHEKGARGITRAKAVKYARLYGVTVEYVLGLSAEASQISVASTGGMMVKGSVEAGAFREAFLEAPERDWERIPVQFDGAYLGAEQFALRVSGASMDEVYPDGSYVVCVLATEAEARLGDHVVVQRQRHGLYEYSLKELTRNPKTGRLLLVPRSQDPAHQTPLEVTEGAVEIIAVVIGSYQRRDRRGPAAFVAG